MNFEIINTGLSCQSEHNAFFSESYKKWLPGKSTNFDNLLFDDDNGHLNPLSKTYNFL